MIADTDRTHLLTVLQRHGVDLAVADPLLEVAEVELPRYLSAVDDRLLDPPLADKLRRVRKIQLHAADLAAEITEILTDEHQLREIAVRLTGTTPAPLADALAEAQGALLTLSARLAAAEAVKPPRGRRPDVPLDPLVDALAAVWHRYLGEPTATREGPFEESLQAILTAAGIATEETYLYDTVRAAVSRRKKAATPR